MDRPLAGISIGWIFDTVPDTFCNVLSFLRQQGADAVELCLTPVRLRHLVLFWNQELAAHLASFTYVSFHLPEINWKKEDPLTHETIERIKFLLLKFKNVFVVRPDTIEDWEDWDNLHNFATNCGICMAIEFPIDRDKKSGRTLKELERICDYFPNFGFVLDVQHAFENDPSGELAIEAARIMSPRLRHLHVSGQKQRPDGLSRHSFLYEADNKKEIEAILRAPELINVPRISEGEFKTCDKSAVTAELDCLRSVLRSL